MHMAKWLKTKGETKTRRGEDWRRSRANATTRALDKPTLHTIGHYTKLARLLKSLGGGDLVYWGQDHEGAYRGWPLRDPDQAFFVLFTTWGKTVWRHSCMLFGGTAFVWGYCRVADFLCVLASLLLIPLLHYVDDFGTLEDVRTADSGFDSFEDLCFTCGVRLKKKKVQRPGVAHVVQGHDLNIDNPHDDIVIEPTARRREKVGGLADDALYKDELNHSTAATIAGKTCHFLEATEGEVGKAALKAIYRRQHSHKGELKLTKSLRASLKTISMLARHARPRVIPMTLRSTPSSLVYADAFIDFDNKRWRSKDIDPIARLTAASIADSGWGIVCDPNSSTEPFHARGTFPPSFVAKFGGAMAFIYMMEVMAQVIALVLCHRDVSEYFVAFCDNAASTSALARGYGSDAAVSALTAIYSAVAVIAKKTPHLERVSSAANISDGVSRNDLAIAKRHGWRRRELPRGFWTAFTDLNFQKMDSGEGFARHLLSL